MGGERCIQLVENDAWFYPSPVFLNVDLEHPIESLADVQLEPVADGLSGLGRATAANRNRLAVASGDRDRAQDVLARVHHYDSGGFDLIDAGVGGVEGAADGVEPHLSGDRGFEISLKLTHGGQFTLAVRAFTSDRAPVRW